MIRSIVTLALFYIIVGAGCNGNAKNKETNMQEGKFKVGQVWRYQNRPGEDSSTITILKVEKYNEGDTIVHIRIDGIKIPNSKITGGYNTDIQHLPYSQKALSQYVTVLAGQNNNLPDFLEGYNAWKKEFDNGRAGYFTISISEAINGIASAMKTQK